MSTRLLYLFLVLAMALPAAASQFLDVPFDETVRGTSAIVRGTVVGPVTSAWDPSGEVIYSYATVRIDEYLTGSGPLEIRIREVGGTVGDYTQQAIGFPELRSNESVVLLLTSWDDGPEYRIHAYSRGKYLVRENARGLMLFADSQPQGSRAGADAKQGAVEPDYSLDEFRDMVRSIIGARDARPVRNR
jgi:hypothetical protein